MFDPDYDCFLQIVECGSISAAARLRHVSAASLSKRLVRLEERLGVRLIHRTTRKLALTAQGRDLVDVLRPIKASLVATEDRLAGNHAALRGPLRITAPTSFGRMHIVPALPAFLSRHAEVELAIDLSDEFADLFGGDYDLAIRIGVNPGPGLVSHRLGTSRRVLCAAPGYVGTFGAPDTLQALADHRLLATESQLPWQLDGPDGSVLWHGSSFVRTNSSEVVRELALGGCGVALRSLWDVAEALDTGALVRVLPQYQGSHDVGFFAVHAPVQVVPARVQALIDHLELHLGSIPQGPSQLS